MTEFPENAPKYCPYCGEELTTKQYDGRERLYCTDCDEIIWQNPLPAAGVMVKDGDSVLMIERGIWPNKGKWSIPAGFMEWDEEPTYSAARELEEETNLETDPEGLELLDNIVVEHPDGKYVLVLVYTVDLEDTAGPVTAGDDAEKAEFWTLEDLENRGGELEDNVYKDLLKRVLG